MKREKFQEAAKRYNDKMYFKSNEPLSQHLAKPKVIPKDVIDPPATLIPSGTRKLPGKVRGNKKAIMDFLKHVGTSA